MGAAAAQRVQAYMKRKEGKLLKLFDLILLKQFGHLCRKMTQIKFACNYSYSGEFSDKNVSKNVNAYDSYLLCVNRYRYVSPILFLLWEKILKDF